MTVSSEFNSAVAFFAALRQGWEEITGKEIPADFAGQPLWDVLQQQVKVYRYEQSRIGLAFRAGRSGFQAFLDRQGEVIGLRTTEFRLHPMPTRLQSGLTAMIQVCQESGFPQLDSETTDGFCLDFGESLSEVQLGYLMGFFQEFFEWASQGHVYPLRQRDANGFCFASDPLNL